MLHGSRKYISDKGPKLDDEVSNVIPCHRTEWVSSSLTCLYFHKFITTVTFTIVFCYNNTLSSVVYFYVGSVVRFYQSFMLIFWVH